MQRYIDHSATCCGSETDPYTLKVIEYQKEHGNRGAFKVGSCKINDIDWPSLEGLDFIEQLDEQTQYLSELASTLFTRIGTLKDVYKRGGAKQGSGIWTTELDDGNSIFFEELKIDANHRRKGLGQKFVEAIFARRRKRQRYYGAIVQPS